MQFIAAYGSVYDKNIIILEVELDDSEVIHKGDMIDTPMHDGTIVRRKVKLLDSKVV